jgi:hypothetical protein
MRLTSQDTQAGARRHGRRNGTTAPRILPDREALMRASLVVVATVAGVCVPAPPLPAQTTDTAAAVAALGELDAACRHDGGRLWGVSLCGPVLLVTPATRTTIANAGDSAGVLARWRAAFVGVLPSDVPLANTSLRWGGRDWAMILLPLPRDRFARSQLLVHESFHRVQGTLGLRGPSPVNRHLDTRDGRLWLRLELRALAAALRATGAARRAAVSDALRFRAYRERLFPGADTLEPALELQEGLAEYTGAKLALAETGAPKARVAQDLAAFEGRPTYVRSFAYATGPAHGLLLDEYAPDWRAAVRRERDTARLLARAVGFEPDSGLAAVAVARAAAYGWADIATQEDARERERRTRLDDYRRRLVDGPVLVLRQHELGTSFDPNALVPFDAGGTVYPTGVFKAEWGTLEVTDGGALVSPDFSLVSVPAPPDPAARPLRGVGWTLRLTRGWVVASGPRPADYQVIRAE